MVFGPKSHGKSTLIGNLSDQLGILTTKYKRSVLNKAEREGKKEMKYAWIMDQTECERQRRKT